MDESNGLGAAVTAHYLEQDVKSLKSSIIDQPKMSWNFALEAVSDKILEQADKGHVEGNSAIRMMSIIKGMRK